VHVLNVWWEGGFEPRHAEGFAEAMRGALRQTPPLRQRRPHQLAVRATRREATLQL